MKESQHTEWKESWRDDYLRWVCGFANAEGGMLVIGRDDKGRVVGIPDAGKLLEELPNKIRDLLGIMVDVNLRRERDREYLEIVTPAYLSPISYRGHYYQRSGSTLQELKGAALIPAEDAPKTSVKTPEALLELLRRNPQMTLSEVAAEVGRSVRAVEMASAKLVKAGKLRFVGPQKGGHWEVIS